MQLKHWEDYLREHIAEVRGDHLTTEAQQPLAAPSQDTQLVADGAEEGREGSEGGSVSPRTHAGRSAVGGRRKTARMAEAKAKAMAAGRVGTGLIRERNKESEQGVVSLGTSTPPASSAPGVAGVSEVSYVDVSHLSVTARRSKPTAAESRHSSRLGQSTRDQMLRQASLSTLRQDLQGEGEEPLATWAELQTVQAGHVEEEQVRHQEALSKIAHFNAVEGKRLAEARASGRKASRFSA